MRAAARFSEVPNVETSILRLLTLMGRELSALLEQLRAIIAQIDRCTQHPTPTGYDRTEADTIEAARRSALAHQAG